jgi:hypothetical protein
MDIVQIRVIQLKNTERNNDAKAKKRVVPKKEREKLDSIYV